jgi:Tat protein translocase TatB subunit
MPSIGPLELMVLAAIALIVFGPEKLPQIARQAGRYLNEFRRMAAEVRDEFETGLEIDEEDAEELEVPPGPGTDPPPQLSVEATAAATEADSPEGGSPDVEDEPDPGSSNPDTEAS